MFKEHIGNVATEYWVIMAHSMRTLNQALKNNLSSVPHLPTHSWGQADVCVASYPQYSPQIKWAHTQNLHMLRYNWVNYKLLCLMFVGVGYKSYKWHSVCCGQPTFKVWVVLGQPKICRIFKDYFQYTRKKAHD